MAGTLATGIVVGGVLGAKLAPYDNEVTECSFVGCVAGLMLAGIGLWGAKRFRAGKGQESVPVS